jgi:hypothetical protein
MDIDKNGTYEIDGETLLEIVELLHQLRSNPTSQWHRDWAEEILEALEEEAD